jgi:hypothetical protein
MPETRVECAACGQDHLRHYRNVLNGERFLLCPECDSVWFPGEDTAQPAQHDLYDVFPGHQFRPGEVAWDFIEPVWS